MEYFTVYLKDKKKKIHFKERNSFLMADNWDELFEDYTEDQIIDSDYVMVENVLYVNVTDN